MDGRKEEAEDEVSGGRPEGVLSTGQRSVGQRSAAAAVATTTTLKHGHRPTALAGGRQTHDVYASDRST